MKPNLVFPLSLGLSKVETSEVKIKETVEETEKSKQQQQKKWADDSWERGYCPTEKSEAVL